MAENEVKNNPNNVTPDGRSVTGRARPGRPAPTADNQQSSVRKVDTKEVLFYTPDGRLCKKVYEITRTKYGVYRRIIKTEKNVKG